MPKKSVVQRSFKAEDNLGLAFKICKKHTDEPLDDSEILSDAYLALVKAEKYFDPTKGFKFSTYAWTAIERQVIRYLETKNKRREVQHDEALYGIMDYRTQPLMPKIEDEHTKVILKQILDIRMRNKSRRIGRQMMKEYYFKGKTHKEIAEKYGCTKQRVQQKIAEVFDYIRSREKFAEIQSLASL